MRSSVTRHLVLALALVGTAISIAAAWQWHGDRSTNVLRLPLDLKAEHTISKPFQVIGNSNYEVALEFDRVFSEHRTECLAGTSMLAPGDSNSNAPSNCESTFQAPQISWFILEDGRPLPCKWAIGGALEDWGAAVRRELCLTPMRTGAHYVAEASLRKLSPNLASVHPRLLVRLNAMDIEQGAFLSIFPTALAVLLAAVGLWQFLRSILAMAKLVKKRADAPPT